MERLASAIKNSNWDIMVGLAMLLIQNTKIPAPLDYSSY